jgi:putative two-component system response regulator
MSHKILVVADEQKIREMLNGLLTKLGYGVTTVESGRQALEKITDEIFSLVFCDVIMPQIDGIATLTKIKEINNRLPVIMMSNFETYEFIIKALEKGATDFITKPLNQTEVNQIINIHLNPKSKESTEYYSPIIHLLRESYLFLLNTINSVIEVKESYLQGHSKRVAEYATKIAEALKLPLDTIESINYAAQLHDLGQVGIDDAILSKTAELTKED